MDVALNNDYIAHLDARRRLTLRNPQYSYYQVKEFDNGCILLEPRELIVPEQISAKTLQMMDESVANFKAGMVSEPIDLSEFQE